MESVEISEFDQGGTLLATYTAKQQSINIKKVITTKSSWEQILDIFLPEGYPSSVSDDYMSYQIFAFSSSIAGMLSSRAVLQGVGVGDPKSHPTTALLLSVFQESFGRIATILFAHRVGSALEPECKMYRFAADILNDAALIFDCLSPAFPRPTRVILFSTASMLRALCGVAAGSAKASLSAHFAKGGNLGDVNAKDSSQETVISLLGMLAGSLVVSWVETPIATWFTLVFLLILHLTFNYAAVRSVKMRSLNRQRANLVLSHLLDFDKLLTPDQVSKSEKLFEQDGALRWSDGHLVGFCQIGVSIKILRQATWQGNQNRNDMPDLAELLLLFEKEDYLLIFEKKRTCFVKILLKRQCTPKSQLKAWFHALILAKQISGSTEKHIRVLHDSLDLVNQNFNEYVLRLNSVGWNMNNTMLETHCGPRISC